MSDRRKIRMQNGPQHIASGLVQLPRRPWRCGNEKTRNRWYIILQVYDIIYLYVMLAVNAVSLFSRAPIYTHNYHRRRRRRRHFV